jgi:glycosyltransferase involved in cell wall biosynthesis
MVKELRILFVSRQPPLPMDNGGRIRVAGLIDGLSARCPVHLITFDGQVDTDQPPVSAEEIDRRFPALEGRTIVGRPPKAKRLRQISALALRRPYLGSGHCTRPMGRAVAQVAQDLVPAVVYVDTLHMGRIISTLDSVQALRVLGPHNVESQLLFSMAASPGQGQIMSSYYRREAQRVQRVERRLARAYDLVCCVSGSDAEAFAALGARRVEVAPNGTWAMRPRHRLEPRNLEQLSLLFVGTLDYRPNAEGLAWFVGDVLPRIQKVIPTTLTVVGSGARGRVTDVLGVRWLGKVSDLDQVYDGCDAALVPLLSGGGSRLKVIEAFSRHVPLVGTRQGVEGLGVEPGVHAWLGDDAAELANACVELHGDLVSNQPEVERRVEQAGRLAEAFSWDSIAETLIDRLEALTRGRT